MARQIVVGIDIGTSLVKVIVAERVVENSRITPKIIGSGSAESRGVSRGYITNQAEAAKSLEAAILRAENVSGVKIRRAYVSFGGVGLESLNSNGSVAITRADLEITERDLSLALEAAEANLPKESVMNKRIINTIPVEYKIDGKPAWGQVLGLKAHKVEVRALFITCLEHHLTTLINTVEEADIEVVDIVASPVAASFVSLSKKQKRVGSLLVDIGAETTSTVVFENNNLITLQVFPVGGADITNDLALGLKLPIEEAENLKKNPDRRLSFPKKKVDDIISARLEDSFDLIEEHLKTIGRNALLPGGSVICGGGSNTSGVKSVAEDILELPSQMAEIYFGSPSDRKIGDRSWAVACGLAIVGFNADDEQRSIGVKNASLLAEGGRRWWKTFMRWVAQFLP